MKDVNDYMVIIFVGVSTGQILLGELPNCRWFETSWLSCHLMANIADVGASDMVLNPEVSGTETGLGECRPMLYFEIGRMPGGALLAFGGHPPGNQPILIKKSPDGAHMVRSAERGSGGLADDVRHINIFLSLGCIYIYIYIYWECFAKDSAGCVVRLSQLLHWWFRGIIWFTFWFKCVM